MQHGIDANRNGKYDMAALGESTFAKSAGRQRHPRGGHRPRHVRHGRGAAAGSVPAGGVATGDGSTSGGSPMMIYAVGGLALLGAAGAVVARRRLAGER